MKKMTSLSSIQKAIASFLQDAEFTDYCNATIGETMTFHVDPSIKMNNVNLPYIAIHKFNKAHFEDMQPEWVLQLILAIASEDDAVTENDVYIYPSSEKIESLADKAVEVINRELSCVGVDGDKRLYIYHYNILISEIGEADDVQAIVTIRLQKQNLL